MLIVLLSRTQRADQTIFVGNKTETLAALKDILLQRTNWTDLIENVLDLITINLSNEIEQHRSRILDPRPYPFRICDMPLPQCRTGYVYMLISVRRQSYSYIGETICLSTRLKQHNSGMGSVSTQPLYLRPFAILAYICGFGGRRILREQVEYQWKVKRDRLISDGVDDVK